jgi:hypothetical protein
VEAADGRNAGCAVTGMNGIPGIYQPKQSQGTSVLNSHG